MAINIPKQEQFKKLNVQVNVKTIKRLEQFQTYLKDQGYVDDLNLVVDAMLNDALGREKEFNATIK